MTKQQVSIKLANLMLYIYFLSFISYAIFWSQDIFLHVSQVFFFNNYIYADAYNHVLKM